MTLAHMKKMCEVLIKTEINMLYSLNIDDKVIYMLFSILFHREQN